MIRICVRLFLFFCKHIAAGHWRCLRVLTRSCCQPTFEPVSSVSAHRTKLLIQGSAHRRAEWLQRQQQPHSPLKSPTTPTGPSVESPLTPRDQARIEFTQALRASHRIQARQDELVGTPLGTHPQGLLLREGIECVCGVLCMRVRARCLFVVYLLAWLGV